MFFSLRFLPSPCFTVCFCSLVLQVAVWMDNLKNKHTHLYVTGSHLHQLSKENSQVPAAPRSTSLWGRSRLAGQPHPCFRLDPIKGCAGLKPCHRDMQDLKDRQEGLSTFILLGYEKESFLIGCVGLCVCLCASACVGVSVRVCVYLCVSMCIYLSPGPSQKLDFRSALSCTNKIS